jgi:hypothetical protein
VSQVSGAALISLFSAFAPSGSLPATQFEFGAAPGARTGGDPLTALRLAEKNRDKEIARAAKEPETLRDVAAFRKAVDRATSIEKALENPDVLKVLLTANGLADKLAYPALARKVLLSDPADPKSLVNRLGDSRWGAVVKAFDFATKGLAALQDPKATATLADGYVEVSWRQGLEKTTPGLADALDFRERASRFTSAIGILGDPVLRRVVTTALGIPREIAFQELPAQEKAITNRLDIDRLQDRKFVDALSQRYLLEKQKAGPPAQPDLGTLAVQLRGLIV